jgi:hypothetical protein
MNKSSFEYVSSVCPELTESEVIILIENLLNIYNPDEIYQGRINAYFIKDTARALFPHLIPINAPPSNAYAKLAIKQAINFLSQASNKLEGILNQSDSTAMTSRDIKLLINHLSDEVARL